MYRKFKPLNIPDGWEQYWSKYPNGYTIMEALIDWVSQVGDMVKNQNELNVTVKSFGERIDDFISQFGVNLANEVQELLTDWQTTGFLDVVISEALQWQLNDYIATNEADKVLLTAQLQQTMTQEEFDGWVATILDGGPSIFFDTLSALQTAYPNGSAGVALIRETDPAKIYVWNGNEWQNYGDYQGVSVKDGSVTSIKTNLGGVHLPKTLSYNLVDNNLRLESELTDFQLGDTIKIDGSGLIQFALLDATGLVVASYRNEHTFSAPATYSVKIKKTTDTEILPNEIEKLANDVIIVNSDTIMHNAIFNREVDKKIANHVKPKTLPEETTFVKRNTNIFNQSNAEIGKMANGDGTIVTSANYFISERMRTTAPNVTISYCRSWQTYTWDGKFVDGANTTDNLATVTIDIPTNGSFYISGHKDNVSLMQVNEGSTLLPFEPYTLRIPTLELDDNQLSGNKLSGLKLLNFGDSIAAASTSGITGYAQAIAQINQLSLTNYAVDGYTVTNGTFTILDQIDTAITEHNTADIILMNGLANDVLEPLDYPLGEVTDGYTSALNVDTFSGALEQAFKLLKTNYKNATIVYVLVHKMDSRDLTTQTSYAERAIDICKKWSIPYVDLFNAGGLNTFLPGMKQAYTLTNLKPEGDGTHPNTDGYNVFYTPQIESMLLRLIS